MVCLGSLSTDSHLIFSQKNVIVCRCMFILRKIFDSNAVQRTCEANVAFENSSFAFTVYVKSVSLYPFKLAYVILHMAVKEFFETHVLKHRNWPF